MDAFWSEKIDKILSVGRSLEDFGVRNWALTRPETVAALDQLAENGVAVLGGDVYLDCDDGVKHTYDNWYCDHQGGESEADFIERSIVQARTYVTNYAATEEKVLFAIVPKV